MKRIVVGTLVLVLVAAGLFVAFRVLHRQSGASPQSAAVPPNPSTGAAPQGSGNARPSPANAGATEAPALPGVGGATVPSADTSQLPVAPGVAGGDTGTDIASVAMGGQLEFASSQSIPTEWSAVMLIDHRPPTETAWASSNLPKYPQDLVFSFYHREPALIRAVLLDAQTRYTTMTDGWTKDVEIWTSVESASEGFTKAASATLRAEPGDQVIAITPVQARFVKIRVLSTQKEGFYFASLGNLKIIEGSAPGYLPLATRFPELTAPTDLSAPPPPIPERTEPVPAGTALDACAAPEPAPAPAAHSESRNVLVLTYEENDYAPLRIAKRTEGGTSGPAIYGRLRFTWRMPEAISPLDLLPNGGIDTVVLAQVCTPKQSLAPLVKRRLTEWVAEGHKLIIQDSDRCAKTDGSQYDFLPFPLATSNPGARGARGDSLFFVEENGLGNASPDSPAFIDVEGWIAQKGSEYNELGDSNTVTRYDPHWCGHLFGMNALKVNGFVQAYAHYGRGLIIYDGFDIDQAFGPSYARLVTAQLSQPFDPDGLRCSSRLSDFVITTEERLKRQLMTPGRTYAYPLTVLSNQGFKGTVTLAVATQPADPTVTTSLDSTTLDVSEIAKASLSVTTTAATPPSSRTIAVRASDTAGTSSTLCLRLDERRSGSLNVLADLPKQAAPAKNLEIILDLSGSMKLPLGKSTRIAVARQVLRDVIAKLPDDYNVGLRFYGHRYGSKQKETCTDSELVHPLQKLNRVRLLDLIGQAKPRGETPLVYSVLQTAADLKGSGGGSVILVTDGEESCGGNVQDAVAQLKSSGVALGLNIVGFTLRGKQTEEQLSSLAAGLGGRYYSAQNGEALGRALMIAAIDRVPYTVYDANGREVARADAGTPQELPPGDYRVVVHAGDEELVAERVTVPLRGDVTVRVVMQNDRLVIQR